MAKLRYLELKGQRFLWSEVRTAYREQAKQVARIEQPVLFEMHDDRRPPGERTAEERYQEPSLFSLKP
jgi:hypothetical protein